MSPKDKALYCFLSQFTTEERKKRFEEVLSYRTRHITIVLEDIYQPHNASAVLRSCDLTGIQDIHIIENKWVYDINPDIVVGSNKWLDLKNTMSMISTLLKHSNIFMREVIRSLPHVHTGTTILMKHCLLTSQWH